MDNENIWFKMLSEWWAYLFIDEQWYLFFVDSSWKYKISFIYDIEKEVPPLEEEPLGIGKF